MPLPVTFNLVTVTATFLRADTAGPDSGSVWFVPQRGVGIDETIVMPTPIHATLDHTGSISVALPCPNSPAHALTSLVYLVREKVAFGRGDYYIEVDNTMTAKYLADIVTIAPAGSDKTWALTAQAYAQQAAASAASVFAALGSLTAGRVPFVAVSGLLTDSASLTYDGKTLRTTPVHTGSLSIVYHDASAETNNGGYNWKLLYDGGSVWTNGPPGEPTYVDDVWTMGIGIGNSVGTLADPTKASLALTMESKYYQNPSVLVPRSEFHIETVDTNLGRHRVMTFDSAHDGSYIGLQFLATVVNYHDMSGAQRIKFDFSSASTTISMPIATTLLFGTNNTWVARQKNSAGSNYVTLPYINDSDLLVLSPFLAVATTPTGGPFAGHFAVLQPINGSNEGSALLLQGPTITGNYYSMLSNGSASGQFGLRVYNSNNVSANARASVYLLAGATNGDPCVTFEINGVTAWTIGADNSDGDAWKISQDTSVGSNDALVIDKTRSVIVGNAALATTATDGFLYIPSCAGTPTGTPTSKTGRVPMVYDSTNDKFYIYRGSWIAV